MRVPGHQGKSYAWRWTAALAGLAVLSFALVMAVVVTPAEHTQAANLVVDNTTDNGALTACLAAAGDCSLRGAIINANGTVATDGITFNIPAADPGCSGGVCTIALTASLPPLNDATHATTITGPTNFSLVVNGTGAGGDCFSITSNGNTIRGLVINNCGGGGSGIFINNANGNTIAGNRIGTDATGTLNRGATGDGVNIIGTSMNNTIGGTTVADRNLISANAGTGIFIAGTANHITIRGNYIGTTVGGDVVLGNGVDGIIAVGNGGNTIAGNVIGGNTGSGITLSSTQNIVQGNWIGVNGTFILPNTLQGIDNLAGINNIGGTTAGQGNVIAHNGVVGVNVPAGSAGIRRNSMFLNVGAGIATGAVPAAPTINPATYSGGVFHVSGTAPASSTVEVFLADPDGQEGQTYVNSYLADGLGNWGGDLCVNGAVGIVATATDTTIPDTSNFSAKRDLPAGTCSAPAPTVTPGPAATAVPAATNTPVNTNTPAPTATRTATPVPGAATVGPMESVTLAGNVCNPVASSYADATAIATIAGAVSPSGILVSIWWFDSATLRWLGYDPLHPANPPSDLTLVDRLDAIFICVSTAGTWSRPVI